MRRYEKTPRLRPTHVVALAVAMLAAASPFLVRDIVPAASAPRAAFPKAPAVSANATSPVTAAKRVPTAKIAAKKLPPAKPVASKPSAEVYRGLGSWVDIYDDRAWNDPAGAVRDMARHGVRTLYLETSNSRQPWAVKSNAKVAEFITAAHANKMRIVAWYLPDLTNPNLDYARAAAAIRFHARNGQSFDSFALDIESPAVSSVRDRNARLEALSRKLRALGGKTYPLGAIIPSPLGISRNGSWNPFPYTMLAKYYDVFVPMSYYTWHGEGERAAYADTAANLRILRAQKGCAKVPVHLIGGLAGESSWAELRGFVRAGNSGGAIGASLYTWTGTTKDHWTVLRAVR